MGFKQHSEKGGLVWALCTLCVFFSVLSVVKDLGVGWGNALDLSYKEHIYVNYEEFKK